MLLYSIILFFVLTPGVLVTLPSTTEGLTTVAIVHAAIFGVVYHFTYNFVFNLVYPNEFKDPM